MDGEIVAEDYQRMKNSIEIRRGNINMKLVSFKPQNIDIERKLGHAINVIRNMDKILSSGRVEHKIILIGSMFPEKILLMGKIIGPIHTIKCLIGYFRIPMFYKSKKKKKQTKNLFLPFLYP